MKFEEFQPNAVARRRYERLSGAAFEDQLFLRTARVNGGLLKSHNSAGFAAHRFYPIDRRPMPQAEVRDFMILEFTWTVPTRLDFTLRMRKPFDALTEPLVSNDLTFLQPLCSWGGENDGCGEPPHIEAVAINLKTLRQYMSTHRKNLFGNVSIEIWLRWFGPLLGENDVDLAAKVFPKGATITSHPVENTQLVSQLPAVRTASRRVRFETQYPVPTWRTLHDFDVALGYYAGKVVYNLGNDTLRFVGPQE